MFRFSGRASRIRNGTAKWNSIRNRPMFCQPPWSRRMYQGISSVRLPAQMIRNCENDM